MVKDLVQYKNVDEPERSGIHEEWRKALLAVNPFIREDAINIIMERMADAVTKYLLQPIEPVTTTDTVELTKAQGKVELLKQQETTMHIFQLCEAE